MTEPLDNIRPPVPKPVDIGRLFSHRSLPPGSDCRWCWQPLHQVETDDPYRYLLICPHCDTNQGHA